MKDNFDYKNDLYNILDAVPVSVFWKDRKGRYLGCNKYMCDLVGLHREEIIGKTDKELLWSNESNNLNVIDYLVTLNKAKYEVEEVVKVYKCDTSKIFLSTKTPLLNCKKEVVGIIGISSDITDRKKMEEMKVKKEVAEKTASIANSIAGSIAHELKNPLCIINLCIDKMVSELKRPGSLNEKERFFKKEFGIIKSVIYSVNHVINNILQKIRVFALGKIEEIKEESNIIAVVSEAIKEYPFKSRESNMIEIKGTKKNDFTFTGDKNLLKHVFSNLIKNSLRAIKETSRKGKIIIEIDNKKNNNFNYIIFSDNGCGIDKEMLDKVFNYYETKYGSSGGTGLGLYFCRMVMNSFGGNIICASEKGEYALFKLSFPKIV